MRYRPEIDGLRALAVVSVILNHINPRLLPSGFLGVDIFFVISGFVITGSLRCRPEATPYAFLAAFYARRVKRLLPALILCVIAASVLICMFDYDPTDSLETGMASLVGLSNVYLWYSASDYFSRSIQLNVFTHTWSLGVEEQFYVLFPLLVLLTGFSKAGRLRWFMATMAVATIVSFAIFLFRADHLSTFYLMPARVWEFGAGCIAYTLSVTSGWSCQILSRKSQTGAVLILLIAALFIPANFSVVTTIIVVGLTAVLLVCLDGNASAQSLLCNQAPVYLGRISYSLYLWHWPVLSLSRWTIGIHWWSVPLQMVLMLALAASSYHFLENPLRRVPWALTSTRTILWGVLAIFASGLLLVLLYFSLAGWLFLGKPVELEARGVGTLSQPFYLTDTLVWRGDPCILSDNREVGVAVPLEDCTLGDFNASKRRVLVIGNSFSAAVIAGFGQTVLRDNYSVTVTSSWGASPIASIANNGVWGLANDYYWSSVIPAIIGRMSKGDAVVLVHDFDEFAPKERSPASLELLLTFREGLVEMTRELDEQGISLFVLVGIPFAAEANCDPNVAVQQWFSVGMHNCNFYSRNQTRERLSALYEMLFELEDANKLRVIDVFDIFCPRLTCSYEGSRGEVLYRDEWSHPSIEGARLMSPLIREKLISSIP